MKSIVKVVSTILLVALFTAAAPVAGPLGPRHVSADANVAINTKNFPDAVFRNYVSTNFDSNKDGVLSTAEIKAVTDIDVTCSSESGEKITSLKGVEIFTGLTSLACAGNNISNLDVSRNTALIWLSCGENNLTSLDVSNNSKLEGLICSGNRLTSLNLRNNSLLGFLWCYSNQLSSLDVSKNPALYTLSCSDNNLKSLDVSNNTALLDLSCDHNNLTSLSLSKNTLLESIYCPNNNLTSLDVSNNTALKWLQCDNNNLTSLNLGRITKLEKLYCYNNNLKTLDVSHNSALDLLYCHTNKLTSLDISHNTEITFLDCYSNDFTSLNISNNRYLIEAYNAGGGYPDPNIPDTAICYFTEDVVYNEEEGCYNYINKRDLTVDKNITIITTAASSSSGSGVSGFVERLYTVALGRASDPSGKADWVDRITHQGYSGADAAKGFFLSDEFIAMNLSDAEFLNRLYHTFFDRDPDTAGFNNWMGQLQNGASRQSVLNGFINSTEWANLCLKFGISSGGTGVPNITVEPSEQVIGFATRLYTTCLGRNPDAAGLNDWSTQLANRRASGSEVAHGFFFSDEFQSQNFSNAEYVTRLYRTFMNREPDSAGYNDWLNQLNNGVSRESVFQGFAGSVEWSNICSEYGIVK